MQPIAKDEMYDWMPCKQDFADARIPDDLHEKLRLSVACYHKICGEIHEYLRHHPEHIAEESQL